MKTLKTVLLILPAIAALVFQAWAAPSPPEPRIQGWQVWPATGERILPSTLPPENGSDGKVRVVTARDAVASASFAIRSTADFRELVLRAERLTTPGGAVLPPEGIDIRVVKCWYQDANGWFAMTHAPGPPVLVPELLLHDDSLVRTDPAACENLVRTSPAGAPPVYQRLKAARGGEVVPAVEVVVADDTETLQPISIARNETRQFYLTISVPASAQAGTYRGRLSLVGDGRPIGHLELGLHVTGHLLPASCSRFSGSRSLDGTKVVPGASPAPLSTQPEPFRAVATLPSLHRSPKTAASLAAIGLSDLVLAPSDLPDLDRYFGGRKPDVLWIAPPKALAGEPTGLLSKKDAVALANDLVATGIGDVRLYLPARSAGKGLAEDLETLEAVDDTGARCWTFVTDETYCPGAAVIRCPMRRGYPVPLEKASLRIQGPQPPDGSCYGTVEYSDTRACERWRAIGTPFYLYSTLPVGIEDPSVWRRRLGVECFKLGYDGFILDQLVEEVDPWNDWASGADRAKTFLYPVKSGFVTTLAWEAIREAITDVRYLSSVNRLAESVRYAARGDPGLDIEGCKAARWLEGLECRTADLDAMRLEAMAWILRLEAFLEKAEP